MLFHYLGAVQLAVYSFAIAITDQIKSPFKNLQDLTLPKFAERPKEEIKSGLIDKILKLSGILALTTILYILFAPFIYKIFFPKLSYISILFILIYYFGILGAVIAKIASDFFSLFILLFFLRRY